MLALPGDPLTPGALQSVLERIAAEDPIVASAPAPTPLPGGVRLPAALAKIGLSSPIHLTPDAWIAHLNAPRDGGWRTYLFCAPAGTVLPRHGHLGEELIVVLEGGFDDGRPFGEGDFAESPSGYVHEMQVLPAGRLVALISSAGAIDWRPADRGIGLRVDI